LYETRVLFFSGYLAQMKATNALKQQLRWQCRRGMLELDLFLQPFLDDRFSGLSQEEQLDFQRLLMESDPTLFTWLTARETPEDPKFAAIIGQLRQHAQPHA
jgi:antitoxin CptB